MIEVKIGNDNIAKISLDGTPEQLTGESICIVRAIYDAFLDYGEEEADQFKNLFMICLSRHEYEIFNRIERNSISDFMSKVTRNGECVNGNP